MDKLRKTSIASAMLLVLVIIAVFLFALQPSQPFALLVGALLASVFGLYFRFYEENVYSPKLDISIKTPIIADFDLRIPSTSTYGETSTLSITPITKSAKYHCNRLLIRNKGMRAAEGCKADLKIGDRLLRICWTVPKERPSATINANSEEQLDVCAVLDKSISQDTTLPRRIAPTETGWRNIPRDLDKISLGEIKGELIISSKNTDTKTIKIRILPFEKVSDNMAILIID